MSNLITREKGERMKRIFAIVAVLMLVASSAFGAVGIMPPAKITILDNNGNLCNGCKVCIYETGSSTFKTTYTDNTGSTANTNPVVANSRGEVSIWYEGNSKIKIMASSQTSCATGTALLTQDNVPSVPATADLDLSLSEWMTTGNTSFVYVSGTQFSVSGDSSLIFQVGRRVHATSSGELYGRITASSYAAGVTTVTVAWDSGTLNAGGITAMEISVPTVTNKSLSFDMVSSGTSASSFTNSGTNTWSGGNTFSGAVTHSGATTLSGLTSSATITTSASVTSTVSTGTAPFVVASTTKVSNLNADTVDDKNPGSASGIATLDSNTRVVEASNLVWDGVANRSASATAGANTIPVSGSDNKIAVGFDSNRPIIFSFLSSAQTVTLDTLTKVQLNSEGIDTNSNFDNVTNYRFTPTISGKYLCHGGLGLTNNGGAPSDPIGAVAIYKNGSVIYTSISPVKAAGSYILSGWQNIQGFLLKTQQLHTAPVIVDMNGSTDYIELYGNAWDADGTTVQFYGGNNTSQTPASFLYCARVGN